MRAVFSPSRHCSSPRRSAEMSRSKHSYSKTRSMRCVIAIVFGAVSTVIFSSMSTTPFRFQVYSADENGNPNRATPNVAVLSSPRHVVSYVYFESESQTLCEKVNKRINLAVFILKAVAESQSTQFHFTFPGSMPGAAEFFSSLGIDSSSPKAQLISKVLWRESAGVTFHLPAVPHPAPDLCHHYHALRDYLTSASSVSGTRPSLVFLTNDGMRGPFHNPSYLQVC